MVNGVNKYLSGRDLLLTVDKWDVGVCDENINLLSHFLCCLHCHHYQKI